MQSTVTCRIPTVAVAKPSRSLMIGRPSTRSFPRRQAAGLGGSSLNRNKPVVVQAGQDFDSFLISFADKFEKTENKVAVVGYSSAAVLAFFFIEWFIHLPVLDVLLGFTVQLLGILALPYFVISYVLEDKDILADLQAYVEKVASKLPGL